MQLAAACHTAQASCYCNHSIVQLAVAACCCWHRALQWRLEEANLEIFILQGSSYSLCKALVQSPSVFMSLVRLKFGPLGEPLLLIGEQQKPRKIVILGIKSRKIFWPAQAQSVSACGGSNAYFSCFHTFLLPLNRIPTHWTEIPPVTPSFTFSGVPSPGGCLSRV